MPLRETVYGLPDESETRIKQEFENLDGTKQDVQHISFDREPLPKEVGEGQFVLALVSGVNRVYTKIKGKLFRVDLVAV